MIDVLAPITWLQAYVRRGVARAVSSGIRDGFREGVHDALGLTIDVEATELPALEPPVPETPQKAPTAAKKPKTPARNGRATTRKATAKA